MARPLRFDFGNGLFYVVAILTFAGAAAAAPLPLGPVGLNSPSPDHATFTRPAGDDSSLRVNVRQATEPFYEIALTCTVGGTVAVGDRVLLRFRGRSPTGNPLRAVVEQSRAPWTAVADAHVTLTPDWRAYRVDGTVTQDFPSNGLACRFQMGQRTGVVELADVCVENLGVDPARAAASAAMAPEAIDARIEQVRKTTLTVEVLDAAGRPLPGAAVAVRQLRHAFLFGCNIFRLEPGHDDAWQQAYQKRYTDLLNYATLPFYWNSFESQRGRPDYPRLDAMARWCAGHGIVAKGHPLVWHEAVPGWAPATAEAMLPLLQQRVAGIVSHYRESIRIWDVVNEANAADGCSRTNGEARWIERDGASAAVATALGWARAAAVGATGAVTLLYNDFDTSERNVALLDALAKHQALPDAIGIQSHMHRSPWPLEDVWLRAERFARFGKPVHFTEVTVLSGPARTNIDYDHDATDWITTPEGERAQAEYVERFYRVLFSHPALRAITWWDFSDRGAWMGAPAGLVRADLTPKPAYDRLLRLLKQVWWTDAHGKTDAQGRCEVRAFYGEHEVTVEDAEGRRAAQVVSLPMGGGPVRVRVQVPAR